VQSRVRPFDQPSLGIDPDQSVTPTDDAAITRKLTEQRAFVVWWDREAERQPHGGVRRGKHQDSAGVILKPENFNLTIKTLSGWRTN
jgi:hypothetical protein